MALALPNELAPWGNPLAGLVCIAPFLVAVATAPSFRSAARVGALFGALSTALTSFWLLFFQEFALWTLPGVTLAYTGFGALLGGVLHGLAGLGKGRYRPFLLAAAWVGYEYLRSVGFLGYPWGLVAYPFHAVLPLLQAADITGVWGVSLLAALVNAVFAEGVIRLSPYPLRQRAGSLAAPTRGEWTRQALVVAVLLAASLGYGAFRLAEAARQEPAAHTARLVLVQPNGNPWAPYEEAEMLANEQLSEEAVALSRSEGVEPDLVVWGETALGPAPTVPRWAKRYLTYPAKAPFFPYLRRVGVRHLTGAALEVDAKAFEWMNGAVLLEPDGRAVETSGKQHPVPFAEAIPFWETKPVQWFFTKVVKIEAPWVSADRSVVYEIGLRDGGKARFGVPICFEDGFSDLCRQFVRGGADMLVNLTNDSWSQTVSALTQHFVAARFRAVENRRPLLRSTNGGITAVVDATGRVTSILPHFQPGYLLADVYLPRAAVTTTYTRFGDWLPLCLLGLLTAVVIAETVLPAARRRRRRVAARLGPHGVAARFGALRRRPRPEPGRRPRGGATP